jgi:hypothetical protein
MVHYRCGEVTSKNSEKVLSSSLYLFYDTGHRGNNKTDSPILEIKKRGVSAPGSRDRKRQAPGGSKKDPSETRRQPQRSSSEAGEAGCRRKRTEAGRQTADIAGENGAVVGLHPSERSKPAASFSAEKNPQATPTFEGVFAAAAH